MSLNLKSEIINNFNNANLKLALLESKTLSQSRPRNSAAKDVENEMRLRYYDIEFERVNC